MKFELQHSEELIRVAEDVIARVGHLGFYVREWTAKGDERTDQLWIENSAFRYGVYGTPWMLVLLNGVRPRSGSVALKYGDTPPLSAMNLRGGEDRLSRPLKEWFSQLMTAVTDPESDPGDFAQTCIIKALEGMQ
jgi:hypothetical protein